MSEFGEDLRHEGIQILTEWTTIMMSRDIEFLVE